MKITLTQPEIEDALKDYIGAQGISLENQSINVEMTAGRGTNGFTAELDIVRNANGNGTVTVALAETPSSVPASKEEASQSEEEVSKDEEDEDESTVGKKSLFDHNS